MIFNLIEAIEVIIDHFKHKNMTTKCIVLGEIPEELRQPHKIEFVKCLYFNSLYFKDSLSFPDRWINIELIKRKTYPAEEYDVMFAYDNNRETGVLYLGYWNDGVV